jgi:glycosyltransferase involved in cell wall biosynthesis
MKIAFVSDAVYPWNIGGIETLQSREYKELAKEHEVHFFSFRWPGMGREFRKDGVTFHAYHRVTKDTFYRHGRRSIREAMIFSLGVFRLFRYKFDFVQANEFPILHLPILWLYCRLYNCKLILDVAELWDKDYWTSYLGSVPGALANWYASTFITIADAYIANSSVTAAKLIRRGIGKERVYTFTPVIDDRQMKRIKSVDGRQIIFFGRLIKEKRLDRWLDIVKKVSRRVKGLRAVIIGEGPESRSIKGRIGELGLEKTVEFRGFYKETEKQTLFGRVKGSELLLHMSEREGLGVAVLESLALGTPVVLPDYSPIPKEVKSMCIVEPESRIPARIVEMLRKNDKGAYLRNSERMGEFTVSNVNKFYSELFGALAKR